jgi:hypothetical protein
MAIPFAEVYRVLQLKGPGKAISSRGREYKIEAKDGCIVALPRSGRVVIHNGCWLQPLTCQGTRAGSVYNGPYSILRWYADVASDLNKIHV